MAFGRQQLSNPTPQKIIFWNRVISITAGVLMVWMPTAKFIPHWFQDPSTSLLGLTIALSNGLSPLFGVEVKENKVDTDTVTAIEEKKDLNK